MSSKCTLVCKYKFIDRMEEIEFHDWGVTPEMENSIRREKSIQAYWLPEWYDKIKDLTFATEFYSNSADIPKIFPKSMVRWENKSPKDSEFWGPVETREQVLRLFYTSLRCKTKPGSIYCLREWKDIQQEWRCFWNGRITAISGDIEPPQELIDYLHSISHRIPYYRAVMDIALVADKYYIVEFNSWETNSGGHLFDWSEDLLYDSPVIVCRWPGGTKEMKWLLGSTLPRPPLPDVPLDKVIPVQPVQPSCWLLTESSLYVCNDVWLVQLSFDYKPLRWRRGPFRFDYLQETTSGLRAGFKACHNDLTHKFGMNSLKYPKSDNKSEIYPYRYGFAGLYEGRRVFCRFIGEQFIPVFY